MHSFGTNAHVDILRPVYFLRFCPLLIPLAVFTDPQSTDERRLRRLFELLDANGDGQISPEELIDVMKKHVKDSSKFNIDAVSAWHVYWGVAPQSRLAGHTFCLADPQSDEGVRWNSGL